MSNLVVKEKFTDRVVKHPLEDVIQVSSTSYIEPRPNSGYKFIGHDTDLVKKDGSLIVLLQGSVEVYPASNWVVIYELDILN